MTRRRLGMEARQPRAARIAALGGALLVGGAGCSGEPAQVAAEPFGEAGASSEATDEGVAGGAAAEVPPRLLRYLRGDPDRALRFEIDSVPGLSPFDTSIAHIRDTFEPLIEKPDGITFELDETLPPAGRDHEWSFESLDAYAREHAAAAGTDPLTIQVLAVDGRYVSEQGSGTVLGLAWGQRFIALFGDALRAPCDGGLVAPLSQETCEIAERNVWAHEVGHVFGLVDNGLPMQEPHRDAEHGSHDSSQGCLMYWAYEGPQIFDTLLSRLSAGERPDLDLCEHCRADMAAAR